jgi:hypothetical protein
VFHPTRGHGSASDGRHWPAPDLPGVVGLGRHARRWQDSHHNGRDHRQPCPVAHTAPWALRPRGESRTLSRAFRRRPGLARAIPVQMSFTCTRIAGIRPARPEGKGHSCGFRDGAREAATSGRAVQVDPTKSMLTVPETKRLKLRCVSLLSNVTFDSNMRLYIPDKHTVESYVAEQADLAANEHSLLQEAVGPGINCSRHPQRRHSKILPHFILSFLEPHAARIMRLAFFAGP